MRFIEPTILGLALGIGLVVTFDPEWLYGLGWGLPMLLLIIGMVLMGRRLIRRWRALRRP